MSQHSEVADEAGTEQKPAWGAVFAMSFGVFGLITAEFLPVSLLTPIARSLQVTEGHAGQTITVTALVALFTSLFITMATRRIDRRWVLLGFSLLQVVSNLLVAFAADLSMILIGRMLLGVAIGGFWTLSTATAMRLVPASQVPKALSIVFSGVSLATIIATPLGSFLGEVIGWRNIFLLAGLLGALALLWQFFSLPAMPADSAKRHGSMINVLLRPGMRWGMLAIILLFTGHFAFFTYMRPFLETVAQTDVNGISGILLAFGVANFFGTSLAGYLLMRNLHLTLSGMTLLMSLLALLLVLFGHYAWLDGLCIALWGMAFGAIPVGWSTWITRTVPDEAESGGGLLVATIQLAITVGAAAGGWVFDASGARGVFMASFVLMLLAATTIFMRVRARA